MDVIKSNAPVSAEAAVSLAVQKAVVLAKSKDDVFLWWEPTKGCFEYSMHGFYKGTAYAGMTFAGYSPAFKRTAADEGMLHLKEEETSLSSGQSLQFYYDRNKRACLSGEGEIEGVYEKGGELVYGYEPDVEADESVTPGGTTTQEHERVQEHETTLPPHPTLSALVEAEKEKERPVTPVNAFSGLMNGMGLPGRFPDTEPKPFPTESKPLSEGAGKEQKAKRQWSLLPWSALEEVVKVFEEGNKKYERDSWRGRVAANPKLYVDALMRHFTAYEKGVKKDKNGVMHLAAAAANALILLYNSLEG